MTGRKRLSLGSSWWTPGKVDWRQSRLSRTKYVLDAQNRSLETRAYREEKAYLDSSGYRGYNFSRIREKEYDVSEQREEQESGCCD